VVYFFIHFYNNDLDIFPTFLPFSFDRPKNEILMKPNEFYETCFRSLIYVITLLVFCFCIERQNVKNWLINSCVANGLIKIALAGFSGEKLANNYDFYLNLLDEL